MKNLIKKNLLFEKPRHYSKLQQHAKAMNSKIDNPDIAPERYHSSKLIAEFEASSATGSKQREKKQKLVPTNPKDFVASQPRAAAPRLPDTSVSLTVEKGPGMMQMRAAKNDMLSQYFKSKKSLNA